MKRGFSFLVCPCCGKHSVYHVMRRGGQDGWTCRSRACDFEAYADASKTGPFDWKAQVALASVNLNDQEVQAMTADARKFMAEEEEGEA